MVGVGHVSLRQPLRKAGTSVRGGDSSEARQMALEGLVLSVPETGERRRRRKSGTGTSWRQVTPPERRSLGRKAVGEVPP